MNDVEKEEFDRRFGKCSQAIRIDRLIGWVACREWRDTQTPIAQINQRLVEALEELMYARTDKAESMAKAALAAVKV